MSADLANQIGSFIEGDISQEDIQRQQDEEFEKEKKANEDRIKREAIAKERQKALAPEKKPFFKRVKELFKSKPQPPLP